MLSENDEAAEAVSYPLTAEIEFFFSLVSTKLNSIPHSIRFVSKCFLSVITFLEKFYDVLALLKSHLKAVEIEKKKIIKE